MFSEFFLTAKFYQMTVLVGNSFRFSYAFFFFFLNKDLSIGEGFSRLSEADRGAGH